jgi:plasmid stability protein
MFMIVHTARFDGMLEACCPHAMAKLQVKDVPEDVHRRLRECARRRGKSQRELVLEALGKELSHDEFERRLQGRSRVRLSRPAGEVLAEVRAERER